MTTTHQDAVPTWTEPGKLARPALATERLRASADLTPIMTTESEHGAS